MECDGKGMIIAVLDSNTEDILKEFLYQGRKAITKI